MSGLNDTTSFQPFLSTLQDSLELNIPVANSKSHNLPVDPRNLMIDPTLFHKTPKRKDVQREEGDITPALEVTIEALTEDNERLERIISRLDGGLGGMESLIGMSREEFERLDSFGELDENLEPTPTQLTTLPAAVSAPAATAVRGTDPFVVTRDAILAELEEVRAKIKAMEDSSSSQEAVTLQVAEGEVEDAEREIRQLEGRVTAFRDYSARLSLEVAQIREELSYDQSLLNDLIIESTPNTSKPPAEQEDGEDILYSPNSVLREVMSYISTCLLEYRETGQLPTVTKRDNLPASTSTYVGLKSGRPRGKIRRRHPRDFIPPELRHLLPDDEVVQATQSAIPLRKRGVKRTREDLDKDRKREEEEGDLLKSLRGVLRG